MVHGLDMYKVVRMKGTMTYTSLLGKVEGNRSRASTAGQWLEDVKKDRARMRCRGSQRTKTWRKHVNRFELNGLNNL